MTYFVERLAVQLASLAGRPPTEVCSAMRTLVLEFSMNDLRDDMTMLVLRAGEPPAPKSWPRARGLRGCR
jgi:Stage II sporulation protein E (SpoIIE)